jgi:acetyltransferase-like isoleucine patch superfamily enzyme
VRRPSPRAVARDLRDRIQTTRLVWRTNAALVPPPASAFARFGGGATIVPPARVENPGSIVIGEESLIHEHVWLMARPQPGGAPSIVVGDRVLIMRFIKIVALESVTIGNGAVIGDHSYISDVEYEPGHPALPPDARPLTTPKPVVLEPFAFLGVGVIVKPGVTIGERAYVGAGSIVTEDIAPRSLAVGAPARVVKSF